MPNQTIDVIVPVYNAYEDLKQCIESVQRLTDGNFRLILVNDCSPDPRISEFFTELEKEGRANITLLHNETNLGFVGTVNRAMGLSQHDVVLLNSDTIVTRAWLAKIRRCADSDSSIGTITPFSNNAEICSFPEICVNNEVPQDPELVNNALEEAAVPLYPDIPTGVGFCMYIRRALLKKIGLFDVETFGLGYGEENDFCMRALQAGYRNVLCDDAYVLHVGNRSFDTKKVALAEENMRRLVAKHPDYLQRVTSFIAADPLRPVREMAKSFLALQGNSGAKPGILHVLHGRKGGTDVHVQGLARACKGDLRQYILRILDDNWIVEDINGDAVVSYEFKHEQDELWADFLGSICTTFKIDLCHVHHLAGSRIALLEAFAGLKVPYGFTVHDFYLACPSINLLDSAGEYCGALNDAVQCQNCLNSQPSYKGVSIVEWRRVHQEFIARSRFTIAPTAWAAETFCHYFKLSNIYIVPHGVDGDAGAAEDSGMCSALLLPHDKRESIGVLGAIGPVKGARRLEKLVSRTRELNLPLRWVVIGYLDRQFQPYQDEDKTLTVHGQYDPKNMESLLDHYRIRLAVFPSAGPETYCYTLTESWSAGCPALVPSMGTLGERVAATGAGWVMDDWQDEDRILEQIMTIISPENLSDLGRRAKIASGVGMISTQQMADEVQQIYRKESIPGDGHANCGERMPSKRLLQAVTAAAGREVTSASSHRSVLDGLLLWLAHLGLRFRYTLIGRWLFRITPVSWQQGLKRRLLGG